MKTYRLHKGRTRGASLLDESEGIRVSAPTTGENHGGINVLLGQQEASTRNVDDKPVFRIEMRRDEAEKLRDALTNVLIAVE